MRRTTMIVVCTFALALCAKSVGAQSSAPDTLKVDYFDNANIASAPDGKLRITNPGTSGGGVCAAIFVFDVNQELSECCSCYVSPNGLRKLSVNTDLTSSPLTGVTLHTGVIEVVSTKANGRSCPLPSKLHPTPSVRAWVTHIQDSTFTITEAPSQDSTLSSREQDDLQAQCEAIILGTHNGICTCGTGD